MADESALFIKAVEKCKAIWDTSSTEYYNEISKLKAWEKVSKEVNWGWQTRYLKERDRRDMKRKWGLLKKQYKMELLRQRDPESGTLANKRTKWMYFDDLSFLKPIFDPKPGRNINPRVGESDMPTAEQHDDDEEDTDTDSYYNALLKPPPALSTNDVPTATISGKEQYSIDPKLTAFESRIIQTLSKAITRTGADSTELNFFKSLLPSMRKMDDDQKLEFKYEIIQLLKKTIETISKTQSTSNISVSNIETTMIPSVSSSSKTSAYMLEVRPLTLKNAGDPIMNIKRESDESD